MRVPARSRFSARDVAPLRYRLDRIRSGLARSEPFAGTARLEIWPWLDVAEGTWLHVQGDGRHFILIPGRREALAWQKGRGVASPLSLPVGPEGQGGSAGEWVLVGPLAGEPEPWPALAEKLGERLPLAERLGSDLAMLHTEFAHRDATIAPSAAFRTGRLRPDFQVTARSHPDLAGFIEAVVKEMTGLGLALALGRRAAELVLFASESPVWLGLDTAHRGDPAVDVSTLLADLLVRACTADGAADAYVAAAAALWKGYISTAGPDFGHSGMLQGSLEARVCRQIGVLVLASVDGEKARNGQALLAGQDVVRAVGRSLLMRPFGRLEGVFTRVLHASRHFRERSGGSVREQAGGER